LSLQVAAPFAGASHWTLQPPQLLGSCPMSMHRESHLASPALQSKSHFDAAHLAVPPAGAGQAVAHAPQLFTDPWVSTHAPEQFVSPESQAALQCPPEQTSPGPHATSHAPQCMGLVSSSTQLPSQEVEPDPQLISQCRSTQRALPPAGAGHSAPHFPQFCGSSSKLTHTLPHAEKCLPQAKLHVPPRHTGPPLTGAVHVVLQPPQLSGSVANRAH
jgi:hypothetical protein